MTIDTSAPTRIDLAGGTIDIWPLYLFHDRAQTINAAISIRAQARIEPRQDSLIVLHSTDTDVRDEIADWSRLRDSKLRLLGFLVHWFLNESHVAPRRPPAGLTLTTHSESPAGAGIAGSSALNVAVCAALAEWTQQPLEPETLLEIAKNVEAQVINVPTGLQDYRPAMYGGVAALEVGVPGIARVALDVDLAQLERRIVLCYTGEPRDSGTNNWEITRRHLDGDAFIFECFERIRDTAAALRRALTAGDWDAVGRAIAEEWDNRKRLAPRVTTPAIDRLIARAMTAGATAAKVCGAGGGGCLFCYGPPEARQAIERALSTGGARLLPFRIDTHGLTRG